MKTTYIERAVRVVRLVRDLEVNGNHGRASERLSTLFIGKTKIDCSCLIDAPILGNFDLETGEAAVD